jgi:hypothetical protein
MSLIQFEKPKFLVTLHLYNIKLLDEFIFHMNQFVKQNPTIECNFLFILPISLNIDEYIYRVNTNIADIIKHDPHQTSKMSIIQYMMNTMSSNNKYDYFFDKIKKKIQQHSIWLNPTDITKRNSLYILSLIQSIKKMCIIPPQRIQYLCIPNRGQDIGGFMSMFKYLQITQLRFDYYILMHTKTNPKWRREMLKMLTVPASHYIGRFNCVYAKIHNQFFDFNRPFNNIYRRNLLNILKTFHFKPANFHFCGGTFFITDHTFIDFFLNVNVDKIFSELNPRKMPDGDIEYCYERFFGYLMDYHKMKKLLV